jgi:hypothetical protein
MIQELQQVQGALNRQQQTLEGVQASGPAGLVLAQIRDKVAMEVGLTDLGLRDPEAFRRQMRKGVDIPGREPSPPATPQPTATPGSSPTQLLQPTVTSRPTDAPSPRATSMLSQPTPQQRRQQGPLSPTPAFPQTTPEPTVEPTSAQPTAAPPKEQPQSPPQGPAEKGPSGPTDRGQPPAPSNPSGPGGKGR